MPTYARVAAVPSELVIEYSPTESQSLASLTVVTHVERDSDVPALHIESVHPDVVATQSGEVRKEILHDGLLVAVMQPVQVKVQHHPETRFDTPANLLVRTTDGARANVPIHVVEREIVRVVPSSIFVNSTDLSVTSRKVLLLAEKPFEIVRIESPPWIQCSLEEVEQFDNGKRYALVVTIDPSRAKDSYSQGRIDIHCDLPEQPVVHVPCMARFLSVAAPSAGVP